MRKLILISALLLMSVSAQAGESRSLTLAANEEPKAIETVKPAEPAKVEETKTDTTAPKAQASKPAKKTHARRYEGDEAKARRIAARYGVYW
jgi:rubrerythrin